MFDLSEIKYFGDASLGDIEISNGVVENLNSYVKIAQIDGLDDNKVIPDWDNAVLGAYEDFVAGNEILIHVSTSASETDLLGRYMVAKILLLNNGIITLDKKITDLIPREQFNFYSVQLVTIAQIDCLKLKAGGVVRPQPFDPHKLCGGILAFKCYDSLILEGGHIDLENCGIPAHWKGKLRPLTTQETAANGQSDIAKMSGQENFITAERFLLNAGDGAVFMAVKNFIGNADSRIGNTTTHGAAYCRGAYNSVGNKPADVTNIGGSTILICAEDVKDFDEKIIAKYRNLNEAEGAGLCRCYIATNTALTCDEGLYSLDILSDKNRLSRELNIWDYGRGTYGSVTNPTKPLNNYAQVTAINQGGCRLTFANETVNGLTPLAEGTRILVQVIQKVDFERAGEIIWTKILKRGENYVVVENAVAAVDLSRYQMQIISVPEFANFTLSGNYTATQKFNGKVGGVFAIAVNNICDLKEGLINVEGKGGALGSRKLAEIANATCHNRLIIGAGHGSVFILAKEIVLSENSRIGATYSGLGTGNRLGGSNSAGNNIGGGYSGAYDEEGAGSAGGYNGGGSATSNKIGGLGGSGANGGTSSNITDFESDKVCGGYGGNGLDGAGYRGGRQGAHLLIIAGKIENYSMACFSTGGEGGQGAVNGLSGASGYGGGAAESGSSGGSSGKIFILVNSK